VFGPAVDHFAVSPPEQLASPALSPGDLELFYVHYESDAVGGEFRRTTRATSDEPFAAGAAVAELAALCSAEERMSIDLSHDGLTAYLLCFSGLDETSFGALRIARRSAPSAGFVVDAATYGEVGASPAVSPDQLAVYTTAKTGIGAAPLLFFERPSLEAPFGAEMAVPGLEDTLLASPDLGPDDLQLFAGFDGAIGMASRSSTCEAFGAPAVVVPRPVDDSFFYGAPDTSPNCRSIYFVTVVATGAWGIASAVR
jgi:hypothetical protein